ncbi:MAG TPA: ABC transporter permease [Terriglobia bacterium]|nr:ABC transporter permease [Terriglobia bacterium]
MLNDMRYAFRTLRQNPGFALTAILSIALAIGANSAIFSWNDGVLFRPLAVEKPSEIVTLSSRTPSGRYEGFPYRDFVDLRDQNQSFEGLVAYRLIPAAFARDEKTQPQLKMGFLVTGNFFDVLGVDPNLGRGFQLGENEIPGRDAVIVLAYDFWKNELGGDPSIVGRHVRLGRSGGVDFTVIGVAPESFTGMDLYVRPAFFIPAMMGPRVLGIDDMLTSRSYHRRADQFTIKGRLKPGVSIPAADADVSALAKRIEAAYPDSNRGWGAAVRTEMQSRQDFNNVWALVAASSGMMIIVLLIACANVANLTLGRGRARAREIAVRLSIGASRVRLIRQLMAESLLVALAGGALGLLVAQGAVEWASTLEVLGDAPVKLDFRLDARVLYFTLIVSAGSAVLFGLVPALHATKTDLTSALKAGELIHARQRFFGRNALVTVQIAGSLVLLMAAAEIYRANALALNGDPGFRTDHRITIRLDPSLADYTSGQTEQFYRTLIDRSREVPGVQSAALSSAIPLTNEVGIRNVAPEGYDFPAGQQSVRIYWNIVDENYFKTLAVPILAGRGFLATDQADSPRVAVVNEVFSQRFLGGNPIGKRVRLDDETRSWVEVVGVSVTGKYGTIIEAPSPFMHLPFSQSPRARMTLVAESFGEPAAMTGPLRELIRSIDPNMPILTVRTMDDIFYQGPVKQVQLISGAFSVASLMGFLLAVVGLYAVVAYQVARRTREIGIRMALGAERLQVMRMILKQAAVVAGIGIIIGLVLSFVARPAVSLGRPVSAFDPLLFSIVPLGLLLTTLVAAAIPARRASQIDPQKALRQD